MKHAEASAKPKKALHKEKRSNSSNPDKHRENGVPADRKKKRDQLALDVSSELRELRNTMDELLEHFRLRMGGQIAELQQALAGSDQEPKAKPPSAKTTAAILELLRSEDFKPKKGRGKDFVKLQRLVKEVSELLPPEG